MEILFLQLELSAITVGLVRKIILNKTFFWREGFHVQFLTKFLWSSSYAYRERVSFTWMVLQYMKRLK